MGRSSDQVKLEPSDATTTRGYHKTVVQMHHQYSGLKANQEGVESPRTVAHYPFLVAANKDKNNNCDKTGAGCIRCNEDVWQSLIKLDKAVEGGRGRSKHDACSILLVVFSVTCLVVASYALGTMLGAVIRLVSLNGAQGDAYSADSNKSTSSLLVIDTAGMSRISLPLIPFLTASLFIQNTVIDLIVNQYTLLNGVDKARLIDSPV
jgi:hypothetical protein